MPELRAANLDVVLCQAAAATLDRLVPPGHGARLLRTAPDEILFVSEAGVGHDVVREVTDRVAAIEPDALVLDVGDGWAAWDLLGADAAHGFSYLSPLVLPEGDGFVQGEVAHIAAKVWAAPNTITILVPASWSAHLRERALRDAGAIEVATS